MVVRRRVASAVEAMMKKVAWILASGALIAACGGGPSRADSGPVGSDSGTIVLMDSGPGGGRDTGPVRRDSGGSGGMCSTWGGLTATSIEPVPASCMPRCSAATLETINMCPEGDDGTCLFGALNADTLPSVSMPFEGGMPLDLNCGLCFDLQRFHCFSQVCPAAASPVLVCNAMMDADMCMGEQMALRSCLMGIADGSPQQMMLQACFGEQVGACFDAGGGFLPGARTLPDVQIENIRRVSAAVLR
jgi:hypothetical protein